MTPQHYPIEPGTLFGGEYPGDRKPEIARVRITRLVEIGVRSFIDLTTGEDPLESYGQLLVELERETGTPLRRISIPVQDMGVPDSAKTMLSIITAVRGAIQTSPAAYIHCRGGIGRTGTVVGCWLRECGLGPDDALARVQQLYASRMPKVCFHPESPQTPVRKNYIRLWQSSGDCSQSPT